MFSVAEVVQIEEKYGELSSWAIWDLKNQADISIIEDNIDLLHSRYVFLGLNTMEKVGSWDNFRIGKHDRKLKFAFNSIPEIKGAYMTDLIKMVELSSSKIMEKITRGKFKSGSVKKGEINIEEHVQALKTELEMVKYTPQTKFIVLGNVARELYDEYFEKSFPDNKVYYFKHYSGKAEDKEWVEYVWSRLNITHLDFTEEIAKYTV